MKTPRKLVARNDRVTINHEFASLDAFINEYISNISASGVFIRSRQPLPIGSRVNLKFTVIVDELEIIEGVGEVVRLQESPPGMGVVFVELTNHSRDLLQTLMTARRLGERKPKAKAAVATTRSAAVPPPAPAPRSAAQVAVEAQPGKVTTKKSSAVPPPPPPKKTKK
jgi:uncharacterized protein (TIGR02266 family)